MAGITSTSTLADTIPTIIEKARLTEQYDSVIASKVQRITKGNGKGSTVNVPYFGTVTPSTLTEGEDMASPSTLADTNVQITLNEIGVQVLLTDNLLEDDQEDIRAMAGEILGSAMTAKREQDIADEFDDGTNSLCGSGTTLTMGHIAAARACLQGNAVASGGPCPGPYSVFLHPYTALDLVDVVTPIVPTATYHNTQGGAFTDDILRNYSIGKLFGMNIYETGNVSISGTDIKGGVIGPKSIILATARNWKVEAERDASLRAWELNVVGRYGVSEYLAGWVVELYADATTPA